MSAQKILSDLVAINSVFPSENRIGEHLERKIKKIGFKTFRQTLEKNRFNIFAERGSGKNVMLFYGHMDTVPVYGDWKTNPFALVEKENKLYGLGACDMKGGIAAIMAAVEKLDSNQPVKIVFGVDEENISAGVFKAVSLKKWFQNVGSVIVAEPGASLAKTGGINVVTLGRRGRVVFRIKVGGKSSHGALPTKGISAIEEAAKLILELNKMTMKKHKRLGEGSLFVRKVESESTSLSVPEVAYIEVDQHIVIPETVKSAKKRLEEFMANLYKKNILAEKLFDKLEVTVKERNTPYIEPYCTDTDNVIVKKILSKIKEIGSDIYINYGRSVADDNVFATKLGLPVITIGPEGGNIHSANEWISKKSLKEIANLFYVLATN